MAVTVELYENIAATLDELLEGYGEILKTSEELQQTIVKGDAQKVGEIVKVQREKTVQMEAVELKRASYVSILAREIGRSEEELSIFKIAELAGTPWGEALKKKGRMLLDIIERQQMLNVQNKELLELHFEYMNFVIDNFLREPQVNNIYGSAGQLVGEDDLNGHVDNEV